MGLNYDLFNIMDKQFEKVRKNAQKPLKKAWKTRKKRIKNCNKSKGVQSYGNSI